MHWISCKEEMPGQKMERISRFLVCYHHGDDEPFLVRAYLNNGKFIIDESCNSYELCPDQYQEEYWNKCIVTHWMHINLPDEFYKQGE